MESFINKKNTLNNEMEEHDKPLEDRIPNILDEAISLMSKKGRVLKIYSGLNSKPEYPAFEVHSEGMFKLWPEGRGPRLGPITRWKPISKDEFLQWVAAQPDAVKEKVYQNLDTYITTETPKERGEVEFPESEYLMGY